MDEVSATMKVVEDIRGHEKNVLVDAYENSSLPVRNDPVGRVLDGYDFINNNPPGFAVGAALDWQKEHGLDR